MPLEAVRRFRFVVGRARAGSLNLANACMADQVAYVAGAELIAVNRWA